MVHHCTRRRERGRVRESENCQKSAVRVPVVDAITSGLRGIELRGTQEEEKNWALYSTKRCCDALYSTKRLGLDTFLSL